MWIGLGELGVGFLSPKRRRKKKRPSRLQIEIHLQPKLQSPLKSDCQ
jgi:hypothetical protein